LAYAEPLECHRTILVLRRLAEAGVDIAHIHADGSIETHSAAMERLIAVLKIPGEHMFRTAEEVLEDAYRKQGDRIAYEATRDSESEAPLESLRE
jgi:hypothetical protein